jgi:Dockerin type I domain
LSNQLIAQTNNLSCSYLPNATERTNYNAIMAQKNNNSGPPQVLTVVPLNATIPIYFWINKAGPQFAPTLLEVSRMVERVNAYFNFPNNAHFVFCGVSYLNESSWYTMSPTINHSQVFSTYKKANAINVFIPQTATNWFETNNGDAIVLGDWATNLGDATAQKNDRVFAHELGHFFRLFHTFNDAPDPSQRERVIRTAVQGRLLPNWNEAADKMVSTAADPFGCKDVSTASVCTEVDDNQDAYAPTLPITNTMSYHYGYPSIFTTQQQDKMNTSLQTSDRAYLINGACAENHANVGSLFRTRGDGDCIPDNQGPIKSSNANITIKNTLNGVMLCSSILSNSQGSYQSCNFPINTSLTITPTKNTNYLQGVTMLDVALISKHVLGIEPFTRPFQMLAADVDNNGDIDANDMLYIRRLILGIITAFPNNVGSWRFVPDYFLSQSSFLSAFSNNPFTASTQGYSYLSNSYMDKVSLNMALSSSQTNLAWKFSPFKVGDVNYCNTEYNPVLLSAPTLDPNSLSSARVANNLYTISTARTTSMNSAEERTIVLKTKNAVSVMAFQLGMRFLKDKFKINQVQKGEFDTTNDVFDFNSEDKGEFRALWYDKRGQVKNLKAGTVLLTAKVKANVNVADLLAVINLDDQILANEFYDAKGKLVPVDMEWTNEGNTIVGNTMTVNAFPNPFTNEVSFDINSPVAGSSKITITNIITGQSHTSQKQLAQGANLVTINNVASLSAGALTYTIVVGTQVVNGSITKAR